MSYTTCAVCNRVIFATDADADGRCCFCQPVATTEAAPITPPVTTTPAEPAPAEPTPADDPPPAEEQA